MWEWPTWDDFETAILLGTNVAWAHIGNFRKYAAEDMVNDCGKQIRVGDVLDNLFDGTLRDLVFKGNVDHIADGLLTIAPVDVTGRDPDEVADEYGLNDEQIVQ